MPESYIEKILRARVYDIAKETPLDYAKNLSHRWQNQIFLKREDLQPVFSFKLRGAYNKMFSLSPEEKGKGVVAASAGNHAQGVALSARTLGIKATIVMPCTTPEIKVKSVGSWGAEIILYGDTYDEACKHAMALSEKSQKTFVHPYDDPEVIAGQGTIAMELLRQYNQDIHAIFVPVGGGGLITGIGTYIKYVRPDIKIVGVEPEDAPSMYKALQSQRRVILNQIGIFADGVAVKQVGKETFRLAKHVIDEMLLVSTDEICAAIKDIFDNTRAIVEPAGALGIAGIKKYIQQQGMINHNLIAINSGANMNFDRLRHVSERTELGEQREALLAVTIPEHAGSFLKFCQTIGKRGITEFNYRYSDDSLAQIFVGLEMQQGEKQDFIQCLQANHYPVLDMSDNEMAKLHIRHMVGGHAPSVTNEQLYRFEFPERPGALLNFLTKMGHRWNISLFHYRNHASAYGRVLVGVQVPKAERKDFTHFLKELGYQYWNETKNPVIDLFVSSGKK